MSDRPDAPSTPEEIIEDLRERAGLAAEEMNEGQGPLSKVVEVPLWRPEDTLEWEAAALIERWHSVLRQIAGGCSENPKDEASTALKP